MGVVIDCVCSFKLRFKSIGEFFLLGVGYFWFN